MLGQNQSDNSFSYKNSALEAILAEDDSDKEVESAIKTLISSEDKQHKFASKIYESKKTIKQKEQKNYVDVSKIFTINNNRSIFFKHISNYFSQHAQKNILNFLCFSDKKRDSYFIALEEKNLQKIYFSLRNINYFNNQYKIYFKIGRSRNKNNNYDVSEYKNENLSIISSSEIEGFLYSLVILPNCLYIITDITITKQDGVRVKQVVPIRIYGKNLTICPPSALIIHKNAEDITAVDIASMREFYSKVYSYVSLYFRLSADKKQKLYLQIPLLSGLTANNFVEKIYQKNKLQELYKFIEYIVIAFEELNKTGISHGDIRLENFIYDQNEQMLFPIKIKFSEKVLYDAQYGMRDNLVEYPSPEIFLDRHFTPESDYWALGMLLLHLLCKQDEEFIKFRCKQNKIKQVIPWALYNGDYLASIVSPVDIRRLSFYGDEKVQPLTKALLSNFFKPYDERRICFEGLKRQVNHLMQITESMPINQRSLTTVLEERERYYLHEDTDSLVMTWDAVCGYVYTGYHQGHLSPCQFMGLVPHANKYMAYWIVHYVTGAFCIRFFNNMVKLLEAALYYQLHVPVLVEHDTCWRNRRTLATICYYLLKPLTSPVFFLKEMKNFYGVAVARALVVYVLLDWLALFFVSAPLLSLIGEGVLGNFAMEQLTHLFMDSFAWIVPSADTTNSYTQAAIMWLLVAIPVASSTALNIVVRSIIKCSHQQQNQSAGIELQDMQASDDLRRSLLPV